MFVTRPSKFDTMGPLFALRFGLQNIHLHAKDLHAFFYMKFANFWYMTCFVPS